MAGDSSGGGRRRDSTSQVFRVNGDVRAWTCSQVVVLIVVVVVVVVVVDFVVVVVFGSGARSAERRFIGTAW